MGTASVLPIKFFSSTKLLSTKIKYAGMVKLANTYGSGPYVARLAGSSPVTRTILEFKYRLRYLNSFCLSLLDTRGSVLSTKKINPLCSKFFIFIVKD